jgi:hypothetical protein
MPRTPKRESTTAPHEGSAPSRGHQVRLARKERLRATAARRQRRARLVQWGTTALLVAALVGAVAWLAVGQDDETASGPGGLPGPKGGSHIAEDVNTMVGEPAPSFTLPDSEGTSYSITPGQGKPLVLVFHMGIT